MKKNGTGTRLRLVSNEAINGNRTTAPVQIGIQPELLPGDALKFHGAKPRDDITPLADGGGTDVQRPSNTRGVLKVIQSVFLKHARELTTVQSRLQPQSKTEMLTSVNMDKLATLAERLIDAMGDDVSASDLARACSVSPAAVSKWLDGRTAALKADTLAAAARALGVREEWLRTGRLPRERVNAQGDREIDKVIAILRDLRGPLAALASAIDAIGQAREEPRKRSRS